MKLIAGCLLVCLFPFASQAADLFSSYSLAQKNDPQIRAAEARRNAEHEVRPQALAALLPNVALSGEVKAQQQDVLQSSSGAYNENYATNSLALNISQPLFYKGAWIALEQADDQISKADSDFIVVQQNVMLRVAQAYFAVLAAQDQVTFAETEQKAIAQQLEQAEERLEVGVIAITDVYEVQARFDLAQANVISAHNNLGNAQEALREIIQENPTDLAPLQDQLVLQAPQPEDIDAWSKKAQQNNAAIRAAQLAMDIARKNIAIKQAGHYPTLDLVGSLNRSRSNANFGSDVDSAAIALQLAVPLYRGGSVTSATRRARFEYQAAVEFLEQQRRAVERQVRDAYRGIQTSISRVQALQAAQVSAQAALEATQAGFDAGTRTLVDVLNSQRDIYRAKRDYAQSRYDYILSTLSLLQAAGTLSAADLRKVNAWLQA